MLRKAYCRSLAQARRNGITQLHLVWAGCSTRCTLRTLLLTALSMAWGAKGGRGVDDLVDRLTRNDPSLASLHIFASRRFGLEVHASLIFCMPRLQLPTLTTYSDDHRRCSRYVQLSNRTPF